MHHLKYVPAIDAANALNGIFASEGGVLVVAEPVSNSLLINAVPGALEEVTRLADQIDQPPATVTIDVLLAEIKLSAPGPAGKDRRKNNCRTSQGDSPIFATRKSGQSPTCSFAGPKGKQPPGTGRCEPRSSVSSDDIDAQLAALRKQGELKTLFRSSLMTLDNQPASICISGNTFHVTPRVAADRLGNATALVIMEIHLVLIRTPGGELISTQPAIEVPSSFPRLFVSAMPETIAVQSTIGVPDGRTSKITGLTTESKAGGTELVVLLTPRIVHPAQEKAVTRGHARAPNGRTHDRPGSEKNKR